MAWTTPSYTRQHGVLVCCADDALLMCTTREQAEAAVTRLTGLLVELGLELKAAKARIVHLVEGGEGSISAAFTIGWCAGGTQNWHQEMVLTSSRRASILACSLKVKVRYTRDRTQEERGRGQFGERARRTGRRDDRDVGANQKATSADAGSAAGRRERQHGR
jgi:hypothetical protein